MAIVKDFRCKAHGEFETDQEPARCPHGCKTIIRIFPRPPAFKSDRTKTTDAITKWQARQMGLTDLSLSQGRSVAENQARKNWQASSVQDMLRPHTFDVPREGDPRAVLSAMGGAGISEVAAEADGKVVTTRDLMAGQRLPGKTILIPEPKDAAA